MSDVRCLILSHKRAGRVTTHRRVANCDLTCEERQVDAYRKAHPELADRIVPHPDDLTPSQTRQWMLDLGGDQIHLDDDMIGIFRIYRRQGGWKKSVLGPERAYELVQQTADTAREMGAFLFGWGSHANPMTYDALRPFKLGGYSPGGAMGILAGSKLHMPIDVALPVEDYWICCLNAYFHRYAFYDARFAAAFDQTYSGSGGMTEYRAPDEDGVEPEVAATAWLRRQFGDVIQLSKPLSRAAMQKGPTRRQKNPARRQIHLPFSY